MYLRPVDRLGRICLPVELLRKLNIEYNTKLKFTLKGNEIIVERVGCVFCDSVLELINFNGLPICSNCRKTIGQIP